MFQGEDKLNKIEKIDKIWKDFFNIFVSVKDEAYPEQTRVESIKKDCFDWLLLFDSVYSSHRITPYIHVFGEHLWEMVKLHGNINLFTMEGLEKLNDFDYQALF